MHVHDLQSRLRSLAMLLAAFLLMLRAGSLHAQGTTIVVPMAPRSLAFDVSSLNGFAVHGEARGAADLDYSAGASVTDVNGAPLLHRLFLDRTHHLYLGYDLYIAPADDPQHVRVHFTPLSDLSGFQFDQSAFVLRPVSLPADGTVAIGEATDVVLETSADSVILRDQLRFKPRR